MKDQPAHLTSREAAEQIGTTPRELRVWLRSADGKVHAQRNERDAYAFDPATIPAMTAAFKAWATKRDQERQAARVAKEATA